MSNNKLIIFGGLPGVGKSTLSRYLAEKYKMVYVRIDEIEQAIMRATGNSTIGPEGYEVGYRIALDNLRNGLSVVADSVNSIQISRAGWKNVAVEAGVQHLQIEIICSDMEEHQRRVEKRFPEIQDHKLPTWADVDKREYETWHDADIVVDTGMLALNESKKRLDNFLKNSGST